MKKLILSLLTLSTTILASHAQEKKEMSNPYFSRLEVRLAQGIGYEADNYNLYEEYSQTEALAGLTYGPFFVEAGAGMTKYRQTEVGDILLLGKIGMRYYIKRFSLELYANLEKNLRRDNPVQPKAGMGLSGGYRITDKVNIVAEFRSQHPAFTGSRHDYYYRTASGVIAVGISFRL